MAEASFYTGLAQGLSSLPQMVMKGMEVRERRNAKLEKYYDSLPEKMQQAYWLASSGQHDAASQVLSAGAPAGRQMKSLSIGEDGSWSVQGPMGQSVISRDQIMTREQILADEKFREWKEGQAGRKKERELSEKKTEFELKNLPSRQQIEERRLAGEAARVQDEEELKSRKLAIAAKDVEPAYEEEKKKRERADAQEKRAQESAEVGLERQRVALERDKQNLNPGEMTEAQARSATQARASRTELTDLRKDIRAEETGTIGKDGVYTKNPDLVAASQLRHSMYDLLSEDALRKEIGNLAKMHGNAMLELTKLPKLMEDAKRGDREGLQQYSEQQKKYAAYLMAEIEFIKRLLGMTPAPAQGEGDGAPQPAPQGPPQAGQVGPLRQPGAPAGAAPAAGSPGLMSPPTMATPMAATQPGLVPSVQQQISTIQSMRQQAGRTSRLFPNMSDQQVAQALARAKGSRFAALVQ